MGLEKRRTLLFLAGLVLTALAPRGGSAEIFPGEDSLAARLRSNDIAVYYEIKHLMNVHQMRQYLTLPSSRARATWVERFWLERDPTPTTKTNERRVEHEKRLLLARESFPSQHAPGWDDRGEVVLRYGVPDVRRKNQGSVVPSGVIPPSEIWIYSRPPMVITFEDTNLIGEYTRVLEPGGPTFVDQGPNGIPDVIDYTPSMLQYVDWAVAGVDVSNMLAALFPESHPDDYPLTKDELREAIEKAPAIYSCDLNWKWLPLCFDITSFKGGERSLRAEVHFEVPAESLRFVPKRGGRAAEVEFRVTARDLDMREVASAKKVITPFVAGDSLPERRLLPAQICLSLQPGYYHVGVEAYDKNSGRRAALTTTAELPAYGPELAVSDIEFASAVEEAREMAAFQKGALRVVPHPMRSYTRPFPVSFYFEIYGLTTDRNDMAFYRVEYRIDPFEKKRWGPVLLDVPTNISQSFEASGYGSMQPERLSIATENLWEGPFKLIVTVTDRRTGRAAVKSARFRVLE